MKCILNYSFLAANSHVITTDSLCHDQHRINQIYGSNCKSNRIYLAITVDQIVNIVLNTVLSNIML